MSIYGAKKSVILLLIVMLIGLLGSGCMNNTEAVTEEPKFNMVTDHMGREVMFPENPQRILALNPLIMEGLFAIGITPVAKVDNYNIREEGKALSTVGSQANINIEAIHGVKPDLILAHIRNHGQIIQSLEETGATVYVFDPAKFGDNPLMSSIVFVGELLDRNNEAQLYMEQVNATAEKLKGNIKEKLDMKSAVIIESGDTIRVAQSATSYGSVIHALGLNNIVPDNMPGSSTESFIAFDIETIIEQDPDIILVLAPSNDPEQNKLVMQRYKSDPMWADLTAVKNDRIKMLPFKFNPGRATAEEMIEIAAEAILSEKKQ